MPIQTRLVPLLLAILLAHGCAGDDAAKSKTAEGTAAAPATTAGTEAEPAVEAGTATEAAASAEETEAVATPATMAYGDSEAGGSAAGAKDEPLEVCWSEGKSTDAASYKVAGNIKLAPGRRPDVDQLVLIATDAPINEWMNGGVVPVYSVGVAMLGSFKFEVKSGPTSLYLCAFAPPTFDDNQPFTAAGCTTAPITGKAGVASTIKDVELVVSARNNPLLTLGGARFGSEAWTGGRVQRTVSGTVRGVKAQGFVIAVAPTPILEEEDSTSEPLGMTSTGKDGSFSLSYFAAPRDPLFVCAMAFDDALAPTTLTGTGCMAVKLPQGSGSAATQFKDLVVELSADSERLDADDASHIALLQRCLGGT